VTCGTSSWGPRHPGWCHCTSSPRTDRLLHSSDLTVEIQSRRLIDLRLWLPRGFDVRECCYENSSYLPKFPIYELKGLVPRIPDISMTGKGSEGSHDLRFWVLHGSGLRGFRSWFSWRDRFTQPPGELPIAGQSYGKLSLPVTFGPYKAGKVGHTLKSWTSGAPKPRGHNFLRLSPRFLGIGHMGPFERISSARLPNEGTSPF
jgi:hypothetical protein